MSLSLYDISVPAFLRGLGSLAAIVEKGRAFADERGIAHATLLDARLIEDMAPFTAQIQRVSDTAKNAAVRVGQVESVAMADTETSFAELQVRIAATIAFLEAVSPESMAGRDEAEVILKTPNREFAFSGRSYITDFALPNFYFHLTTAYALLRAAGVPIGKIDFLGGH